MAETTKTATEFNFKRPDGNYGANWSENQANVTDAAKKCLDALKAQGATDQTVEVVSRTRTTSYSDESHFASYSTDGSE